MQTVNGHSEALAALQAGCTDLISPPYAACHAGVGYYVAWLKQLRASWAGGAFRFTLCCGDDPATAQHALAMGMPSIRYLGDAGYLPLLERIAKAQQVTLLSNDTA